VTIFERIAEANIKDWLRKKEQPDYRPPTPVEKTVLGKPFEGHLFDEIKQLLYAAHHEQDDTKKKALLSEATNLEIRLALSYETQGYCFLARHVQGAIQKYKNALASHVT